MVGLCRLGATILGYLRNNPNPSKTKRKEKKSNKKVSRNYSDIYFCYLIWNIGMYRYIGFSLEDILPEGR